MENNKIFFSSFFKYTLKKLLIFKAQFYYNKKIVLTNTVKNYGTLYKRTDVSKKLYNFFNTFRNLCIFIFTLF